MAKLNSTIQVQYSATMTVTEAEMRALDALVGYGDEAFIKAFKEKLGKAYLRDHEHGLKSFFGTVRRDVLPAMRDIDTIRKEIVANIRSNDHG